MIYAINSTDQYRLEKQCLQLIKELNIEENDVFKFNATDTDEGDLLQELCTSSLFGQKCVVIYHPVFLSNDYTFSYKQDFINYFTEPNEDVILILLIDFNFDSKNELIQLLSKKTEIKKLAVLDEKDLNSFIKSIVEEEGYSINENALVELIKRTKADTVAISNEISKLKLYCDNKTIKLKDVTDLVTIDLEKKLYELSNLYFSKKNKELLETYYDLVKYSLGKGDGSKKESTTSIFSSISNHFISEVIKLFYTKSLIARGYKVDDIAEFHNVSKGKAFYMDKEARNISNSKLLTLFDRLSKLDNDLKFNSDPNLAVELFLLNEL